MANVTPGGNSRSRRLGADKGDDASPIEVAILTVADMRMDAAQLGSIAVAEQKARTTVKFRRPIRVFEDALQKSPEQVAEHPSQVTQLWCDSPGAWKSGLSIKPPGARILCRPAHVTRSLGVEALAPLSR